MKEVRLSVTSLNLMRKDPVAFWMKQNGIAPPGVEYSEGNFVIRKAIWKYLDNCGVENEKGMLGKEDLEVYERRDVVEKCRNWKSGWKAKMKMRSKGEEVKVEVVGQVDDFVIDSKGNLCPVFINIGMDGFIISELRKRCDVYAMIMDWMNIENEGETKAYVLNVDSKEGPGMQVGWEVGRVYSALMDLDISVSELITDKKRAMKDVLLALEVQEGLVEDATNKVFGDLVTKELAYSDYVVAVARKMGYKKVG